MVLFFTGVVMIFVLTGATLVIPWNRIAYGWVAVARDRIVAITLMQLAAPGSALGLLWIFPTTWLAGAFGLLGLTAVIIAVAGIVSILTALNERQITYATVLMPLVLVAVATTSSAPECAGTRRRIRSSPRTVRRDCSSTCSSNRLGKPDGKLPSSTADSSMISERPESPADPRAGERPAG